MTTDRLLTIGLIAVLVIACAGLAIVGAALASSGALGAMRALPAAIDQEATQRGVTVCGGLIQIGSCTIDQESTLTTPAPEDDFNFWDWAIITLAGVLVIIVGAMAINAFGLGNEAPR